MSQQVFNLSISKTGLQLKYGFKHFYICKRQQDHFYVAVVLYYHLTITVLIWKDKIIKFWVHKLLAKENMAPESVYVQG